MNEFIEKLYENIIKSTDSCEDAIKVLKKIKGNILCVGTGGSKVVSDFSSKVIEKKNGCITKKIDISDIDETDKKLYDAILICSYSGTNYGVEYSLNNDLIHYVLTSNSNLLDALVIPYEMEYEHSFISLNSTCVPMAILLKYYLGDEFLSILNEIFSKVDKDIFIDLNGESIVNIFYSDKAIATSTFMESTLVEANIVAPLMHKLYSYCHGRHTFNRNHDKKAILIGYNGSDLENVLIENFKYQMKEYIVLKSKFEDDIINDFYLTIQAVYLLRNIALSMNIDLSEIKYDKIAAKRLFNFKGSV